VLTAFACSSPSTNAGARTDESAPLTAPGDGWSHRGPSWTGQDYTFYLVTRTATGMSAAALGAPRTPCEDGSSRSACPITDLDLSVLDLPKDGLAAIEAAVVSDAKKSTEVFVGTFESIHKRKGEQTLLRVQEVWLAPVAGTVRASDDWYHLSHQAAQALLVNHWAQRAVTSVDLSQAPWMSDCDPTDGGTIVCVPTQAGILEDADTPAGILVDGTWDADGTLHVRQYLAKIAIGGFQSSNGYWYCRSEQIMCKSGFCADDQVGCDTHWHGGGQQMYARTAAQAAQPWLVGTTQLTQAESNALEADGGT
jgi:hypothetical protein